MKILINIIILLTSCFISSAQSLLRFDGLYKSECCSFLRFYKDGHVYAVISVAKANSINFLSKETAKKDSLVSIGTYELTHQDRLYLQVTNVEGTIVYEGDVLKNKLKLHEKSLINGYEEDLTFYFIKY